MAVGEESGAAVSFVAEWMTTEREEDEEATSGASSHIVCADGNNVEETFFHLGPGALCLNGVE